MENIMSLRLGLFRIVWVCLPLLGACGGSDQAPISASTMALTSMGNVEQVLRGVHQAGSFVTKSNTLASLLSMPATEETCTSIEAKPCLQGTLCQPSQMVCETNSQELTTADLQESHQELSDAIDDLMKWLRDELLIAQNLEFEDGKVSVYKIPSTILCENNAPVFKSASDSTGGSTVVGEPELDSDCVETVARLTPRLSLTASSDGAVDVAVLLTASKHNPITFKLGADSASVVFDLNEIMAALTAAGEDTQEIEAMTGKVALEIKRHAELDYSLRLNLITGFGLTFINDLAEKIVYELAPHSPSMEIRLDGVARRMTGTIRLGRFSVAGALNAFRDLFEEEPTPGEFNPSLTKKYTGLIHLLTAGFDGSVTLDGQADHISLKSLGLGNASSTLAYDGTVIAKLDLNPQHGRHFDLEVEQTAEKHTQLTFSPTLDLTFLADLAPLQGQIADIPSALLGDTIRLWMRGTNPSVRFEPEQVRVLSGTCHLTSSRIPESSLQATAGMCFVDSSSIAPPAHEWLDEIDVAMCR